MTTPADHAGLRDRIAKAIWERQNPGLYWATCEYRWKVDAEADADAVVAVLPAPTDQAAAPVASTAPLAAGLPLVKGRCPACGHASLFLGSGGYVTCSIAECREPDAASTMLERRLAGKAQQDGAAK